MKAYYKKYILNFKKPSGTSRGVLTEKETWFLILENEGKWGIGECGLLKGLSVDDVPEYEEKLNWVCNNIHIGQKGLWDTLLDFPSIQFGVEQAFLSIQSKSPFVLFPSDFTYNEAPIPINGLVWMGSKDFMLQQIQQKLKEGFSCIKLKIGAIDFDTELELLKSIREQYSSKEIELRVDANGAFSHEAALDKLNRLTQLNIHSIEQPIKQGNVLKMKELCELSFLPIALDEELIGVVDVTKKASLLQTIRPHYIILKPSLIGGFKGTQEWITLAKKYNVGWWITSALESNIGLNAIAQFTYTLKSCMLQGLGTGSLYTNNIDAPLEVKKGSLYYKQNKKWKNNLIQELCT